LPLKSAIRESPPSINVPIFCTEPWKISYFISDTSRNEGIFSCTIIFDREEEDVFLSSRVTSIGDPDTSLSPDSKDVYFLVMRRLFGLINGALRREKVSYVLSGPTTFTELLLFWSSLKPFFRLFQRAMASPSYIRKNQFVSVLSVL